jgi:hypothetical protein
MRGGWEVYCVVSWICLNGHIRPVILQRFSLVNPKIDRNLYYLQLCPYHLPSDSPYHCHRQEHGFLRYLPEQRPRFSSETNAVQNHEIDIRSFDSLGFFPQFLTRPLPQRPQGSIFPIFSLMREFDPVTARSLPIFPYPTSFEPYGA